MINVIPKIWMPLPINAANNLGYFGGLKISPWTSFHPLSSRASSAESSILLYLAISLLNVLIIIIVIIPKSKYPNFFNTNKLANYIWLMISFSQFTCQEKYDNEWVNYWKPMNVHIAHFQVDVPSWSPSHLWKNILCTLLRASFNSLIKIN